MKKWLLPGLDNLPVWEVGAASEETRAERSIPEGAPERRGVCFLLRKLLQLARVAHRKLWEDNQTMFLLLY